MTDVQIHTWFNIKINLNKDRINQRATSTGDHTEIIFIGKLKVFSSKILVFLCGRLLHLSVSQAWQQTPGQVEMGGLWVQGWPELHRVPLFQKSKRTHRQIYFHNLEAEAITHSKRRRKEREDNSCVHSKPRKLSTADSLKLQQWQQRIHGPCDYWEHSFVYTCVQIFWRKSPQLSPDSRTTSWLPYSYRHSRQRLLYTW